MIRENWHAPIHARMARRVLATYLGVDEIVEEPRDLLNGNLVARVDIGGGNDDAVRALANALDGNVSRVDDEPGKARGNEERSGQKEVEG